MKDYRFPRIILFVFFTLIILLNTTGVIAPVTKFLSSETLTFKIGSFQLSLYTLLKAIFAIIFIFWIASIISSYIQQKIRNIHRIEASNRELLLKISQALVYFFAILLGLEIIGIDFTTLTVVGGAIGIGIGFGLQKISSNFISGIILLFEKSIKTNDLIELTDGTYGFIRDMRARYALLETFDGKEIMIPNEDFVTNRVVNWTYSNTYGRIEVPMRVSYKSDIAKAIELAIESASEIKCASEKHIPRCFVREFGESAIHLTLHFWIKDVSEGRLGPQSDAMLLILKKFKKHKIVIPPPQRMVYTNKF